MLSGAYKELITGFDVTSNTSACEVSLVKTLSKAYTCGLAANSQVAEVTVHRANSPFSCALKRTYTRTVSIRVDSYCFQIYFKVAVLDSSLRNRYYWTGKVRKES